MGSNTVLAAVALSLCALAATPADAQESLEQRLKALEAMVTTQAAQIQAQRETLDLQADQLTRQSRALEVLKLEALDETRGRGADAAAAAQVTPAAPGPASVAAGGGVPQGPVGEAPAEQPRDVELAALPENTGVLTPRGHGVIEPSLRYVHGSTNRLVFRGVEIVTGVQIGVIEASDADRTTLSPALAARYGLTNRLELEVVAPYVNRSDRVTTLAQRDQTTTRTISLDGRDIGDVEVGARYQLNQARPGRPIYIASLRYKSDTGTSPFEIDRDEFGVASALATGSGFKGGQAGVSFLYPTDPAVIFGSLAYLYNAPKDIDRDIGGVWVGKVDPGDLPDGRRQIYSFLLPGDIAAFRGAPSGWSNTTVAALTPVEAVDFTGHHRLDDRSPLAEAFAASLAAEQALIFDQVARLGQRDAYQRAVDLLMELYHRLSLAGQIAEERVNLPITQDHLAEALGVTPVHVRRVLQRMKSEGMLALKGGPGLALDGPKLQQEHARVCGV